jgi:CRP/FNR family cyclic AMP-dependent transcriptional regulator
MQLEATIDTEICDILSDHEIFQGLDGEEIKQIAAVCKREQLKSGAMIFEDKTKGCDLYIVLSGRVNILIESIAPHEFFPLTSIKQGEILGEFALIDLEPRSASAVCLEDTQLLVINGCRIREMLEKNHHMGYILISNIARIICERIRRTNRRLLNALRYRLF